MAVQNSAGADGPPPRWQTRSGAILFGSVFGLAIAAAIAALLVVLVPADDDAAANDDNGEGAATATPDSATATPGPEDGVDAVPADFNGTWITNFASMELAQDGTTVTGEYFRFLADNSPRTIEGVLTDRTLDGTFDGSNPIRFQMADDSQSFFGHWADPQGGLHEWCGALNSPLPDGCGYSGEWRVKGFPPVAALEGDSILMSQYGEGVTMRFDSSRHGEVELDLPFDGTTLALASTTAGFGDTPLELEFLVTEDPDWNTLRGTWRAGGQSGQWCAAQGEFALPC